MEVATAAAMRSIDQRTIETYRVPGIVLMENAGLELLRVLQAEWPDLNRRHISILTGPGNNGGDGFILARHLWSRGVAVRVGMLASASRLRGDARRAYVMAQAYGVPLVSCTTAPAWRRFARDLATTSLIVDALLGTGLERPATDLYAEVFETLNASGKPIVAVDIPSGLSADRGDFIGPYIQATHTVTFARPKPGLLLYPTASAAGVLHTVDIGIPPQAIEAEQIDLATLDPRDMSRLIPTRDADSHKGSHGHLFVVAGSLGKTGAAALTSQSGLRSGAGLVTLALPASLNGAMESRLIEVMTLPMAASPHGELTANSIAPLCEFAQKATALVVGPGLGAGDGARACTHALIQESAVPVVLDADGLTHVADRPEVLQMCESQVILTPHPGEMARLLGVDTSRIQSQRLTIAREFAKAHGVIVVLKGARTVIFAPDGQRWINLTGNAALATAGSGDVLAGLIGALLCQGLTPLAAAQAGVYLHGLAGDRVRDRLGATGLIASDLIDVLPHVMQAAREGM